MISKRSIFYGLSIVCLIAYMAYDTQITIENNYHTNVFYINLPPIQIYIPGPKCLLEDKNYSYYNETCIANYTNIYRYIIDCNLKIEVTVKDNLESHRVLNYTCTK